MKSKLRSTPYDASAGNASVRIVADTNIVLSGLLWSGLPQQLIHAARAKRIELYVSVALSAEFAEVLALIARRAAST